MTLILQSLVNLKKCHQWLLQKQFVTKKDFVTAIGDIFTHVTAIADPWVSNGCHKGAHSLIVQTLTPNISINYQYIIQSCRDLPYKCEKGFRQERFLKTHFKIFHKYTKQNYITFAI